MVLLVTAVVVRLGTAGQAAMGLVVVVLVKVAVVVVV